MDSEDDPRAHLAHASVQLALFDAAVQMMHLPPWKVVEDALRKSIDTLLSMAGRKRDVDLPRVQAAIEVYDSLLAMSKPDPRKRAHLASRVDALQREVEGRHNAGLLPEDK